MNTFLRHGLSITLAFGVIAGAAFAPVVPAQAAQYSQDYLPQDELEQLLAPVALYPDALLTQLLIAATYPLDVVQAARFLDQNPNLRGEALSRAAEAKPWDESVKALLQTPSVIVMMNDRLDWTQQLGDAFLDQRDEVMDTVQTLRTQARASGSLQNTEQQRVVVREEVIVIEPARPEYLYVPYYDPYVVYGNWRWSRRPWFWSPPPLYRPPSFGVSIVSGISWGIAIGISNDRWYSHRPDWREHSITINNNFYGSRPPRPGEQRPAPSVWQHRDDRRERLPLPVITPRDRDLLPRPGWPMRDEPRHDRRDDDRNDRRPSPVFNQDRPTRDIRPQEIERPINRPEPQRPQTRPESDDRGNRPRPSPEVRPAQPDTRRSLPETRREESERQVPRPNFDRSPGPNRERDRPERDERRDDRGRDRDRMR